MKSILYPTDTHMKSILQYKEDIMRHEEYSTMRHEEYPTILNMKSILQIHRYKEDIMIMRHEENPSDGIKRIL